MKSRRRKTLLKDLVRQRSWILYKIAVDAVRSGDYEYASRVGSLIRRMSISTRIKPPQGIRKWLCKKCNIPLIPGLSASVRLVSQGRFSYIVIRCLNCGWIHRRPYKKGEEN